tara:strand:- start:1040 stop:1276 length:237 start_codon:yes stop_codon:yes gene_type:complete
MKKGDLAWLPASTSLIQFSVEDKPDSGVKCFCNPKTPTHVLVLGEIEGVYYKVGYRGSVWAVPKSYLYELDKEIRDVG